MGARIPDSQRAAIVADIRAGQKSCRRIAKDHGVSAGTVSALAREHGLSFERSEAKTRAAVQARKFDARAARAQLAEDLLCDAEKLRQRAWSPYTTLIGNGATAAWVTTKLPSLRDQQAAYTTIGIAVDKAIALERHDDDQGAEAGRTMLNDLFGALGMVHHEIVAEDEAAGIDGYSGSGYGDEQG